MCGPTRRTARSAPGSGGSGLWMRQQAAVCSRNQGWRVPSPDSHPIGFSSAEFKASPGGDTKKLFCDNLILAVSQKASKSTGENQNFVGFLYADFTSVLLFLCGRWSGKERLPFQPVVPLRTGFGPAPLSVMCFLHFKQSPLKAPDTSGVGSLSFRGSQGVCGRRMWGRRHSPSLPQAVLSMLLPRPARA